MHFRRILLEGARETEPTRRRKSNTRTAVESIAGTERSEKRALLFTWTKHSYSSFQFEGGSLQGIIENAFWTLAFNQYRAAYQQVLQHQTYLVCKNICLYVKNLING